jgi:hypothetical protein
MFTLLVSKSITSAGIRFRYPTERYGFKERMKVLCHPYKTGEVH